MTIEELEDRHHAIWDDSDGRFESSRASHTELSIQFAIEILESLKQYYTIGDCITVYIEEKIQELKQYLDEEV